MHIGLFKLTIMFFGMTNLLATFQAIINEILRDLVNKGKVTAFVDDVLVETETEKGHETVGKRAAVNIQQAQKDLYNETSIGSPGFGQGI